MQGSFGSPLVPCMQLTKRKASGSGRSFSISAKRRGALLPKGSENQSCAPLGSDLSVSDDNRFLFSCGVVNRSQNHHVSMTLTAVRFHGFRSTHCRSKGIEFRSKFVQHFEFPLEPLAGDLSRKAPLLVEGERRGKASPPLVALHKQE